MWNRDEFKFWQLAVLMVIPFVLLLDMSSHIELRDHPRVPS